MKSPMVTAVLLVVLLVAPARGAAQTPKTFGLAMTRLELSLDLDYDDGSLTGWASYEIANLSNEAVSEVPFNLGRLMTVRAARGPGGETLSLTQDVTVFTDSPKRQINHVVVTLGRPLAPGEAIQLKLEYGGFLVGYTETGSIYIQDRIHEDFSILREDAFAWPGLGTLSRRINRVAPRPEFPFTARITVPERFTVASAGRLVEKRSDNERTTFVYESTAPVPFVNLPVAEYGLMQRAGVRVYYFPSDSPGAVRILDGSVRGLKLLETWFGPLGTVPDLAVMEIPELWGSQASLTGGIIQTADAFRDPRRMPPLYHELSHLWNAPDLDQPAARWNEGLATFLSQRMARELDGMEGMEDEITRTASRLLDDRRTPSQVSEVPFIRYGEAGVTGLSYSVGFLMFYALHQALGDEEFDAALGGYFQDHRENGGTFPDFMERVQADASVDLSDFFRVWVHTTAWYDQLRAGTPPAEIGFRSEGG